MERSLSPNDLSSIQITQVSVTIHTDIKDSSASLELSIAALKALRGLYDNANGEFKSPEQAQAVRLAWQRSEDVVVILLTGVGKSVTFMTSEWAEK